MDDRIEAINKLSEAGYKVGILIAPVIMIENWKELYKELIVELDNKLSVKAKKEVFFEIIFMTYSFVHSKINEEAFPNAINIYDKDKMQGRGKGKYMYKSNLREDGKKFLLDEMYKHFKSNKIEYVV